MPNTNLAADWTPARDLGRATARAKGRAATAISHGGDDVRSSGPQVIALRSWLLGAHGGLDRILVALLGRQYGVPRHPARARANADHLAETIRALSAL